MEREIAIKPGRLIRILLTLLLLAGCAEVTGPHPTAGEQEDLQLAASRRHPPQSWALERTSRVFLRLLGKVPQVHGRTYPFLGFNWWVTARDQVVIDQVWRPSPAQDAGLKPGDVILAAHNWPLYPWMAEGDRYLQTTRAVCGGSIPGELLVSLLLAVKYVRMDLREQYLSGPVELLVQREEEKRTVTLYPQHLPGEYAILVATHPRIANEINAWAAPGRIILSRRYVNFCRTDDELALVIGHELAHQVLGHRLRRAGQRQLTLAVDTVSAFITYTLGYLLKLWYLPVFDRDLLREIPQATVSAFSRGDEREADAYGMWYAFQAGYDVEGALAVMERLAAAVEKDPFYRASFLDSHPASLERMARMKEIARYFQAGRAAEVFLQSANLDRP
ncbi:MAG: M48 family metalloprotease [Deltaproteobacteria bacterium]|nr:M48 family metalloprotease [Deltaproteobacteria bacterium]